MPRFVLRGSEDDPVTNMNGYLATDIDAEVPPSAFYDVQRQIETLCQGPGMVQVQTDEFMSVGNGSAVRRV